MLKDGTQKETFWSNVKLLLKLSLKYRGKSWRKKLFGALFICSWRGCRKLCDPGWDMITGNHDGHCTICDRTWVFPPDTLRNRRSRPTRDAILNSFQDQLDTDEKTE